MSRKRKRILWPAITLIGLALGAGAFVTKRSKTMAATKAGIDTAAKKPSLAIGANVPHGPVQVVRFTLYDAGICPRQARVEKGLVAITIEDLSGGTSGLVVQRVSGNSRQSVGTVQRIQNHWRGRQELQLEPGNYELFMADRPNNKAQLTVAP